MAEFFWDVRGRRHKNIFLYLLLEGEETHYKVEHIDGLYTLIFFLCFYGHDYSKDICINMHNK